MGGSWIRTAIGVIVVKLTTGVVWKRHIGHSQREGENTSWGSWGNVGVTDSRRRGFGEIWGMPGLLPSTIPDTVSPPVLEWSPVWVTSVSHNVQQSQDIELTFSGWPLSSTGFWSPSTGNGCHHEVQEYSSGESVQSPGRERQQAMESFQGQETSWRYMENLKGNLRSLVIY